MAEKVIARDKFHAATAIKRACGVDVSYSGRVAYCSAAVVEAEKMELVELATHKSKATYPYIPGLFFLREAQPALDTLKKLKGGFDLLLVDGHGVLHPRRCGLASYLGVALDVPTIGVAKSLLCGIVRPDSYIEFEGQVLGFAVARASGSEEKGKRSAVYVSVGHRISLDTAIAIVRQLTKEGHLTPEPLRIADINSKKFRLEDSAKKGRCE